MQNTSKKTVENGTINVQRFELLGGADHGWLKAKHHFSFASYYDPSRMGFGNLRVVNDDRVQAGRGFVPHPHRDMEIITYVRQGAIRHKDSMGNEGVTKAGDVQVMSAGTGVTHSEFADGPDNTVLYQIWIEPRERNVAPRWKAAEFPKAEVRDALPLLVSGRPEHAGKGALFIHQYASIYGGKMAEGTAITQPISKKAYLLVSDGEVAVNGEVLYPGDGAEIENASLLHLEAKRASEVLVIDLE